jgi:putative intracellular protease/amidase
VARIYVPLPDRDFDVTEVAVPWKLWVEAGHEVVFATERGAVAAADPLLLTGVLFGQLGAEPEPRRFYEEMIASPAFQRPITYDAIDPKGADALHLAGGHAQGMRQYIASSVLHARVVDFARSGKPLGAICHGTLVLARAIDPATGKSVLHGLRTTCLPKYMERSAWLLTAWKLGNYYRTYPAYVEEEVRAALAEPEDFERGPRVLTARGTRDDDGPAFVVEDGRYVSARWPGDSYLYAKRFATRL